MWLWRLWQIHDWGSLNPSRGSGGHMKGNAPEGGSWSCFTIIIFEPISQEGGAWKLTGMTKGLARVHELLTSFVAVGGA
jgi:hypothetical protein